MTPERLIGLSESDAQTLCEHYNFVMRVTMEDNNYFLCTCDYRLDRINVQIMDGKITKAHVG